MPIKNKDGSTYRLRGPNPLMKDQSQWDHKQLVLHNLKWNGVTIPDESLVSPFRSDFKAPTSTQVEAPPAQEEPEESVDSYINGPVVEIKTETITHFAPTVQAKPHVDEDIPRIVCWCQPAVIREKVDPLYGEKHRTIQYGQKFTFEAVVVELNFMAFQFWTTVDGLTSGSVVFPQIEDRRWWRIQEIEPKTGGWLCSCIISDQHFDFVAERR